MVCHLAPRAPLSESIRVVLILFDLIAAEPQRQYAQRRPKCSGVHWIEALSKNSDYLALGSSIEDSYHGNTGSIRQPALFECFSMHPAHRLQ